MKPGRFSIFMTAILVSLSLLSARAREIRPAACQEQDENLVLVKHMEVKAALGWVDTGLDVKEGEKLVFRVSGSISLQKGNPVASCGPEGLDLQTPQQPLPDRNLGAAVGRVVKVLSINRDEETGEEIREEVSTVFYIGSAAEVEITLEGRLHLGVNDNVYADNDGQFTVGIFRKKNIE